MRVFVRLMIRLWHGWVNELKRDRRVIVREELKAMGVLVVKSGFLFQSQGVLRFGFLEPQLLGILDFGQFKEIVADIVFFSFDALQKGDLGSEAADEVGGVGDSVMFLLALALTSLDRDLHLGLEHVPALVKDVRNVKLELGDGWVKDEGCRPGFEKVLDVKRQGTVHGPRESERLLPQADGCRTHVWQRESSVEWFDFLCFFFVRT